ncbi:type VI secretion system protein TssA [Aureimonas leprariae]|uniref:Type VI secretion system protein TssA n=1 Tax=Plantimonas leprariae TaxID=2615207 RepID=A0A7V7PQ52_9HYPH|nr:type VI secretion system protein TssA [Aureimonas leprariae]KAB0680244.1 type VI secretion system protein TssA [Aureimonas leprariae]
MDPKSADTIVLTDFITEGRPTGVNLRTDPVHRELYYRLKDARSAARGAERSVVPGEPMRLASAWSDVRALAVQALTEVTKDVEVLAWLAEAELRIGRFAGLARVFDAAAVLVEASWDEMHSIDGDGPEDKAAPFAGLNGVGGEGTLIQPIRLCPLVPDAHFFELSLWDYQVAQRDGSGRLRDAVADAGRDAMATHLETVRACQAAFARLTQALDRRCGPHSPPSSNTRAVLEEVRAAISDVAQLSDAVEEVAPAAAAGTNGKASPANAVARRGEIASREEAFQRLLEVAAYFRRTEPHSPLSSSIETLVARGRMDFLRLLEELLPDPHVRRTVLASAGIQPQGEMH